MKTSIDRICGNLFVTATIKRIAMFPVFSDGKQANIKAKCSILTEDGKTFSFFAKVSAKNFDALMLTKEHDEVEFSYDPEYSSLDRFINKTIQ